MLKKALLALIALLLVGGGVFVYLANDADPHLAPANATSATGQAAGDAERLTAATEGPSVADANTTVATERAVAAGFDGAGQRPLPENASWVTVRVVEKATGSPLAGAVVHWSDETSWRWLEEQPTGERPEDLQFLGERLAVLAGWHTRSDAQGYARVTLRESTMVHALHGELYGRLALAGDTIAPVGGHQVELVPDANLHVRVVDANGAPAANVPISVAIVDKNDRPIGWYGWMAMTRTRAPDGLATLPHLQQQFGEFRNEMTKDARTWRVRIHLPGLKDPGVAFDAASPPKEPIELRLPPCGSMRVRATFAGKPLAGFRSAWIGVDSEGERQFGANHHERVGPDGMARFPWVALGATFNVGAEVAGGLQTKQLGPQQPGQEVEVVLSPAADALLLAGRVLLPDRAVAAGVTVNVQAQGPQVRSSPSVQTDRDGRFLASLGSPRKDNKVDKLSFEVRQPDQPVRRAEATARTLRPGVEELGDLVLADSALLVAGRIVADGKPFLDPIDVFVEREEIRDGSAPRWRGLEGQVTQVAKDGTFSVRGHAGTNRLRLGARSRRVLPVTPIEFKAGAADVVVTVERGPGLAATVLLADKSPVDHLSAVLVPSAGDPAPSTDRAEDRLRCQPEQPRGNRANLRWPAVPAGTYRLELRLWTVAAPLLTIPDVVLPLPDGGDPRLVDIDLRPFVRTVTLDLVDAEGKRPSNDDGAVFPAAQANPAEWLGYGTWSAPAVLLLPPGPYDLVVCARAFRPQPVRGDAPQATVRLDAWPKLVVRVPDVPALPERARIQVSLQPTEPATGRYRTQWNSGDRAQFFQAPTNGVAVVEGKAAVPIGDGLFHLKLTLTGNRRTHTLDGYEPKQVLSTAGEVTVTVPKEQWEKGIEVVKQPPKEGEGPGLRDVPFGLPPGNR